VTDPVADACRAVEAGLADPRYAHTSAFRVLVDGRRVHAAHYRGPVVAEVFSVTKTVLATVAGTARLPDLDTPVDAYVHRACGVDLGAGVTWRQLLTMTRPAEPVDFDEVAVLPAGWVARIAAAPATGPGFRYDDGTAHLLSAALTGLLGEPVDAVAERVLFRPLGISGARWRRDPDGISCGPAYLRLSAAHLETLGRLWLDGGGPLDPDFHAAMTSRQVGGGPPEHVPYGYLTWVAGDHFRAGGWAGQHVVVVPAARAVITTTGDPRFDPGPPATDQLPPDWRPALDLVRAHLLPALR
jgi:CubicO group peptidase (beta-lactamase class C family)